MKFLQKITLTTLVITLSALTALAQQPTAEFQVTPDYERQGYRLTYQNDQATDLEVKVRDEAGRVIHRHAIEGATQVSRLYRLDEVTTGTYRFELITPSGIQVREVEYPLAPKVDWSLKVLKDPTSPRFQMLFDADPEREVLVNIYDDDRNLLYSRTATVAEHSDQIFNLSQVNSGSVVFAVADDYLIAQEKVSLR